MFASKSKKNVKSIAWGNLTKKKSVLTHKTQALQEKFYGRYGARGTFSHKTPVSSKGSSLISMISWRPLNLPITALEGTLESLPYVSLHFLRH